jgi:hypothetical protein
MKHISRIGVLSSLLVATLTLGGCTQQRSDDDDDVECEGDSDCSGDDVCERDECVAPDDGPKGSGGGTTDPGTGGSDTSECGDGICDAGESCAADCGGGSDNATLVVSNASSITVYYLYVAPCWASGWGSDQLGSNVIIGGSSFTVSEIPPDCYDLRAEDQSGGYWESHDVDLSAGETFTWTLQS